MEKAIHSFEHFLTTIDPVGRELESAARAHLDDLTKPQGSLGRLEEIALRYVLATGSLKPVLKKKRICCFAADHGVAEEGVSAYPREVTTQMVYNMLSGGAAINVFARHAGATLEVVDMGVAHKFPQKHGYIDRKICMGTANIAKGPAMSMVECLRAIYAGGDAAMRANVDGNQLLGTGEMGIANTTSATALLSVLLAIPPEEITGRGTGIDEKRLEHKKAVIHRAIAINLEAAKTPLGALAALGGLEIAGITGFILTAATMKIPVVVDGFISTAGAVAAIKLCPPVKEYLFFSHLSSEQGHRRIMEALEVRPILDLDLRLGEGTGGALAMQVIEAALKMYNEMATFSSAKVSGKGN